MVLTYTIPASHQGTHNGFLYPDVALLYFYGVLWHIHRALCLFTVNDILCVLSL